MATMLRMNTGFLRSFGVEKTNRPIVIGTRRVGKTVSTTRRFTFPASSLCIEGGSGGRDCNGKSEVEDIAEEEPRKGSNYRAKVICRSESTNLARRIAPRWLCPPSIVI